MAVQQPTLGNCQGGSLTKPMSITAFWFLIRPEGHWEPRKKIWTRATNNFLDMLDMLQKQVLNPSVVTSHETLK